MAQKMLSDEELKIRAAGEMGKKGFHPVRYTKNNGLFSSRDFIFEHCKGTIFVNYNPKIGYTLEFSVEIEDPRTHEGIPESRQLEKRLAALIPEAGLEIADILVEADMGVRDMAADPDDGIGKSGARFVLKVDPLVSAHSRKRWEKLSPVYRRFNDALQRLGYSLDFPLFSGKLDGILAYLDKDCLQRHECLRHAEKALKMCYYNPAGTRQISKTLEKLDAVKPFDKELTHFLIRMPERVPEQSFGVYLGIVKAQFDDGRFDTQNVGIAYHQLVEVIQREEKQRGVGPMHKFLRSVLKVIDSSVCSNIEDHLPHNHPYLKGD